MEIIKTLEGTELTIAVSGRLDTTTAPELEKEINDSIGGVTKLNLDLADLQYVSSAGLRVFLSTQKIMNKQGSMVVKNVNDDIKEILEVTGFIDILTLE